MRYKIKDFEIRSENAAKSSNATASHLVEWLRNRKYTPSALDFGCGKLRYTHHLAKKSKHIGILDSEIQLTRNQKIAGRQMSVKNYAKERWSSCRIHTLEEFWKKVTAKYHFVLCSNVLSAIPCPKARAKSLNSIHKTLTHNGYALFVNQHTNSYFKEMQKKSDSCPHLDGWITKARNGIAAYYGILCKKTVIDLISKHQFIIKDAWVNGQSNYILALKGEK